MKISIFLFINTISAALLLSAEDPIVMSEPVWAVAYEVAGAEGPGSSTVNLFGVPLDRPWAYRGRVASFNGRIITFEWPHWTEESLAEPGEYYFVEIDSGENIRMDADLVSADIRTGTVETAEDLSAYLSVGDIVKVGRHHTFFSVFGAEEITRKARVAGAEGVNRVDLLAAATAGEADEVIIFDPVEQTSSRYFISSELDAWAGSSGPSRAIEDFPIKPEQGILLRRRGSGSTVLVMSGYLKPLPIAVKAQPGVNILSSPPADLDGLRKSMGFRRNQQGERLLPDTASANAVAVRETEEESPGRAVLNEKVSTVWLAALGLEANERVHIIGDTAMILEQPTEEPSTLLILKDNE